MVDKPDEQVMNSVAFTAYLRKNGRSSTAAQRCVTLVAEFEIFLAAQDSKTLLETASPDDLQNFVASIEEREKRSAKGHLWAIRYYYLYVPNEEMAHLASILRELRIKRKPFPLREFRSVDPQNVQKLANIGITNVRQMLADGKDPSSRRSLAQRSGVKSAVILELVKLSDLARIPGVKDIRARLYFNAGVDTLDKIAAWDPEALREMVAAFIAQTGYNATPPFPAEAAFTVRQAKMLPRIVSYQP